MRSNRRGRERVYKIAILDFIRHGATVAERAVTAPVAAPKEKTARPKSGTGPVAPRPEIVELARILEYSLLATIVGRSEASLRRYAGGQSEPPAQITARLRWLILLVGELRGAYNERGVRRWFVRPRSQLHGRTPRDELVGKWEPQGPGPSAVRQLTRALSD